MIKCRNIFSFTRNDEGASLIYVSVMMAIILGFAGLAIDFSRVSILHTQSQAAADAAAIAAASQLDGSANSITRANNAAMTTPLITNTQNFSDGATGNTEIAIASIRYLTAVPDDDDTPIDAGLVTTDPFLAEYAEVTTEVLNHRNFFLPILGVAQTKALATVAVAGQDSAICRVTPLAICNPAEETEGVGANFEYTQWIGKQIIVRMSGSGSQWAPGNFGLMDTPDGGQSAPDLADMLAAVDGADQCFNTRINTKPGQVASLRSALNTRFDIYENPFFKNKENDPRYAPAANVTKGRLWTGPSANVCNNFDEPGAPTAMGLPQDNIFTNASSVPGGRFGNGRWDCQDYWDVNHPTDTRPANCTNNTNSITRYQIYTYEIDNGIIPGPVSTNAAEQGEPVCYSAGPVVHDPKYDRRLVHFAVMNCVEHNIAGNESNVPSLAFVRAFLTEPVGDESAPGNNDSDVFLEIVDVVEPGISDGPLKEFVEIVR